MTDTSPPPTIAPCVPSHQAQLSLARAIHERVLPPLQAVALALSCGTELSDMERATFGRRMTTALADLRSLLMARGTAAQGPSRSIAELVGQVQARHERLPVKVAGMCAVIVPANLDVLIEHFIYEALGNAERHARPSVVDVAIERHLDVLKIEVANDGVLPGGTNCGLGLQLVVEHALQHDGTLQWSRHAPHRWRAELVIPLEPGAA